MHMIIACRPCSGEGYVIDPRNGKLLDCPRCDASGEVEHGKDEVGAMLEGSLQLIESVRTLIDNAPSIEYLTDIARDLRTSYPYVATAVRLNYRKRLAELEAANGLEQVR